MAGLDQFRDPASLEAPPTMQAVLCKGRGFENIVVEEVPTPRPGPDQLLCRVDAAGVCTSILKLVDQGSDHAFLNGWDPQQFPVILGDEGALTVVEAGANLADRYKPGQRFGVQPAVDVDPINHRERYRNNAADMHKCAVGYTLGGNLAQYLLVQEEVLQGQCLVPLPNDTLSYFAVSMGEPISCVVSAQERQFHIHKDGPFEPRRPELGLLPGGSAVVVGAGAMGRMHVELAMRFRPKNLLVSDPLDERLTITQKQLGDKARGLGVNLITVKPDALEQTLREASGGRMADDIILAVGIQPVQQHALGLLGKGGVANLFGGLPRGKHILELDGIAVHYDEIKAVGSSGGAPSDLKITLDAIAAGDIDAGNYVYGIGSLRHAPEVLQMIKEAKVDGKVILYPHTDVAELKTVEHWDQQQEEAFLRANLA